MRLFSRYATSRVCVLRALKVALVVGTVLAVINHYDAILARTLGATTILKMLVTYAVPYSVSTFSSAMQGIHMELHDQKTELKR